jgi:hypothetical protein
MVLATRRRFVHGIWTLTTYLVGIICLKPRRYPTAAARAVNQPFRKRRPVHKE